QPNGDFAMTVARQFLFSTWQELVFAELSASSDPMLASIANKAVKEVAYHATFSAEWVVRLGDGTDESRERMIAALEWLWRFTGELFDGDSRDTHSDDKARLLIDTSALKPSWDQRIGEVLGEAGLSIPAETRPVLGGRQGRHSEHLGHMLTEMQFLQRAYPDAVW
ncbi:MAG: 1,2-phenylacetyl-CoA epoxidase subunit PaaC, partial [Caulobacteraceae bacterium]